MMVGVLTLGVIDAPLGDAEVAALWGRSGAQWLTDPTVAVPGRLVRRTCGLVGSLDGRGAGLAGLVPASGLGLLAERAAFMGLPPSGSTSAGGASRLIRAGDGWLVLTLARPDDEQLVPAWLETDLDAATDLWCQVEALVADRSVADLSQRALLLGLPCGAFGEFTDDRPAIANRHGDAPASDIADAIVVNLAALWAGPLCADILARLGARVITVESTRRPDGGRRAPKFFRALHGRSESVALDLASPSGRRALEQLLHAADVVIEGSRPRALEQMGIDAPALVATGPKVWLSITSHGRAPGVRHRVGFGDDTAAAAGLVGWSGDEPRFIADAVADPLTGLTAAHTAAELADRGGRWIADIALSRVASSVTGGWVAPTSPSERPRPRDDPGAAMPLGRDTDRILREFTFVPHVED